MSRDSGLAHLTGSCQRAGQMSRSLQGWKITDWMPRMDLPCRQKSFPVPGKKRKAGAEVPVAVRAVALNSVNLFDRLVISIDDKNGN